MMTAGRQREFDTQIALKKALHVFWKKGYGGASLSDLTLQMGINKPSLYAAFGNKEALFISACTYFIDHYSKPYIHLLHTQNKSVMQRLSDYLKSIVTVQCDTSKPSGCFISMSVTEAVGEAIPTGALNAIKNASRFAEDYLTRFFEQELPSKGGINQYNARELAIYSLSVLHGTAAQARNGKSEKQLHSVVDLALLSLTRIVSENTEF